MKLRSIVVCMLLCLFVATARGSIIINGSFEEPDIPPQFVSFFTSIPGWTATFGEIELQDNAAGLPFDGNQLVELDAYFNGTMEQVIPTFAGQEYLLQFAYSPRPRKPASTNGIDVFWDGSLLASIAEDGAFDTTWTLFSHRVAASSDSTTLAFAARGNSDSFGGYLDAVSLQPVPEPTTFAIWGLLGITVGVGTWWNRRRTAA